MEKLDLKIKIHPSRVVYVIRTPKIYKRETRQSAYVLRAKCIERSILFQPALHQTISILFEICGHEMAISIIDMHAMTRVDKKYCVQLREFAILLSDSKETRERNVNRPSL